MSPLLTIICLYILVKLGIFTMTEFYVWSGIVLFFVVVSSVHVIREKNNERY